MINGHYLRRRTPSELGMYVKCDVNAGKPRACERVENYLDAHPSEERTEAYKKALLDEVERFASKLDLSKLGPDKDHTFFH
jgi:hypothetical protein